MNTDIEDRIKSFLIGIALPLALTVIAVPYLTGKKTTSFRYGHTLDPVQSVGRGLFILGMGLCTHALGFRSYDNHPAVKYAVFAAGVVSFIVGICLYV